MQDIHRSATRCRLPAVTVRLSLDEKQRFSRLAAASGLSESAVALNAIRILLDSHSADGCAAVAASVKLPATDRVTIRLRPGDGDQIVRRAEQRGMKAATYLAALARAHVAANPPLAAGELLALKQGVVVLAGLGRALVQAARATPRQTEREELWRIRVAVEALEQRVVDFVRAALVSWESRL